MDRASLERLPKEALIDIILELLDRVKALESEVARLKRDSSTSSKPPSTDLKAPVKKNQSLRKKSGKKSGGQKGHKGHHSSMVETPDEIVACEPSVCDKCGNDLEDRAGEVQSRRQEKDIPPITVRVTEYQQISKECCCGHVNLGQYPDHIKSAVQIGSNARSFIVYLNVAHLIPYKRLKKLCEDLFDFKISEGSIANILGYATNKAEDIYETVKELVKKMEWVGADETSVKVNGIKHWLWVWQNESASFYVVDKSRGYQVVEHYFGKDYAGILVHDCWPAHNNTIAKGGHQQCHAHLLRDLVFLIDSSNCRWAYQVLALLCHSQRAHDRIWEEGFPEHLREQVIDKYKKKFFKLLEHQAKTKDENRLLKRLRKHRSSVLLFMNYPYVPPDNNSSEKAIRNGKIKQKVSGGFRSLVGAKQYAVLLSIIETSKKQKMDILSSLKNMLADTLSFQTT